MTQPTDFKFALACGASGAYVDVTSDVLFEEGGIPFTEGRTSGFDDASPGSWSFTLKNGDGKYTPDNPSSSLATRLSEGMGAVMQLGGQLFAGTVRSAPLMFPALEKADQARVRITIDDALGTASRSTYADSVTNMAQSVGTYLWWPLDDPAGAPFARSAAPAQPPLVAPDGYTMTLGVEGATFLGTQMITSNAIAVPSEIPYQSGGDLGWWGWWVTPGTSATLTLEYERFPRTSGGRSFQVGTSGALGGGLWQFFVSTVGTFAGPAAVVGVPVFVELHVRQASAAGVTTLYGTAYVNGTPITTERAVGSYTGAAASNWEITPTRVQLTGGSNDLFANLSLTRSASGQEIAAASTEAAAITAITRSAGIALDTLPALAGSPIATSVPGRSALDALNTIVRTEQGHIWVETSGTLLAPTPKVKVAARNRERAVDYTFGVSEILDPIPFVRALTNTVSQAQANGPLSSVGFADPTLVPLVGPASSSDSVAFTDSSDLYAFASDRVQRGKDVGYPIQSITLDATALNRWSDFDAIRQGHRLHITGLPSSQLGYSTWDGFVVGRKIDVTQDQYGQPQIFFTYYLTPWRAASVYDTDVYDTATYAF